MAKRVNLSMAQFRRLDDIETMSRRPGGFLSFYEPDRIWKALERQNLITRDSGGRLTDAGREALRIYLGKYYDKHGCIDKVIP